MRRERAIQRLTAAAVVLVLSVGLVTAASAADAQQVAPDLLKLMHDMSAGRSPPPAKPAVASTAARPAPPMSARPIPLTLATATPVERPGLDTSTLRAPSADQITRAARDYADALRQDFDPQVATELDLLIAKRMAHPVELGDVGAMLQIMDARAASYLLARAVAIDPTRIGNLHNFGVTLYTSGELQGALELQLYVETLDGAAIAPKLARAWTVLYLGDFRTAETLFQTVIRREPGQRGAYEGLGLLRQGQGRIQEAKSWFAKAQTRGFSPIAAEATAQTGDAVLPDDTAQPPPPAPDDGIERPQFEPGAPSNAGTGSAGNWGENFDLPAIPADGLRFAAAAADYAAIDEQRAAARLHTTERRKQLLDAMSAAPRSLAPTTMDDGSLVYPRLFSRQLDLLDEQKNVVTPQLRRLLNRWYDQQHGILLELANKAQTYAVGEQTELAACGDAACGARVAHKYCIARQGAVRIAHSGLLDAWQSDTQPMRDLLREHYRVSTPLMRQITETRLNEFQNLDRRWLYESFLNELPLLPWASALAGMGAAADCPLPPPEPTQPPPDKDDGKPTPCNPNDKKGANLGGGVSAGVARAGLNLKLSCDKLQIGGELFIELPIIGKLGGSISISRDLKSNGFFKPGAEIQVSGVVGADGPGGGVSHESGLYINTLNGGVVDAGLRSQQAVTKGGVGHGHEYAAESKVSLMPGANLGKATHSEIQHTHYYGGTVDLPL